MAVKKAAKKAPAKKAAAKKVDKVIDVCLKMNVDKGKVMGVWVDGKRIPGKPTYDGTKIPRHTGDPIVLQNLAQNPYWVRIGGKWYRIG